MNFERFKTLLILQGFIVTKFLKKAPYTMRVGFKLSDKLFQKVFEFDYELSVCCKDFSPYYEKIVKLTNQPNMFKMMK